MNTSDLIENRFKENVITSSVISDSTDPIDNKCLTFIKEIWGSIFSKVASLLQSTKKETGLESCIQTLKSIPTLSLNQRMNWNSWYKLHLAALNSFTYRIPGIAVNFKMPLPWHSMQVRINQFITDSGLRTSCGITQQIAITKLLGAKQAAWLSVIEKSNHLNGLDDVLKGDNPLLLSFEIKACDLADGDNLIPYKGHVWTVFQASPDRYLLITSYIHEQDATVMELNAEEMLTHIRDIHTISNAEKWTSEVGTAYKKWFGVSHCELMSLNSIQKELPHPWQVTFKSVQPDIQKVNQIQNEFLQSLQLPYFPKETVIGKGEKLPVDNVAMQEAFMSNKCWWLDISWTVSLPQAINEYVYSYFTCSR